MSQGRWVFKPGLCVLFKRKGFDTPLGEGSINWPAVRTELAKINFSGWAAAEVKTGDWDYLADVARRMDRVLDL